MSSWNGSKKVWPLDSQSQSDQLLMEQHLHCQAASSSFTTSTPWICLPLKMMVLTVPAVGCPCTLTYWLSSMKCFFRACIPVVVFSWAVRVSFSKAEFAGNRIPGVSIFNPSKFAGACRNWWDKARSASQALLTPMVPCLANRSNRPLNSAVCQGHVKCQS